MSGLLRPPPTGEQWAREATFLLNAELGRREPLILGFRHDGTNWHIRFRAALNSPWVQVHVQNAGNGGLVAYDSANFVSSTEVDCRADRLQDIEPPDGRHLVFLIPVDYDGAGTKILFDGEGDSPDFMSYQDLIP